MRRAGAIAIAVARAAVRAARATPVVALLLLSAGCGSKIDEDYQVGSGNLHPFAETGEHGAWLAANGYDFDACTDCHGDDLRGQAVGAGGATLRSCSTSGCHGTDDDELFACNLCHGDREGDSALALAWAPPEDLEGSTETSAPGVGAHQSHLDAASGISAAVPCGTCHVVPAAWDDPGHLDGELEREITFGGIADDEASYDFAANTCATTYCHGDGEPLWTEVDGTWNECGTCHGLPPGGEHPQGPGVDAYCYLCHNLVVDADREIIAPELHVNGEVNED